MPRDPCLSRGVTVAQGVGPRSRREVTAGIDGTFSHDNPRPRSANTILSCISANSGTQCDLSGISVRDCYMISN